MVSLQLDKKEAFVTENNSPNIHLMDYNLGGVGNLPMSIRSKQMVTQKGFHREDLEAMSVIELRKLARKYHVASSTYVVNKAHKDLLIDLLMSSQVDAGLPRPARKDVKKIMDEAPEKIVNDEVVYLFRRLISIMSEEALSSIKKRIKEYEG